MGGLVSIPRLYPITDTELSGLSHEEQVKRLVAGGARLIQLREKRMNAGAFYEAARPAVEIGRRYGARILINDRVDVCLAVGADGVHLGQDDLHPVEARRLLGAQAIIGYSTHSVEQALEALAFPIDYLAIGPIFSTTSKENPDPEVGLQGLQKVRATVGRLPLIAIGGITEALAPQVIDSGADSVAMISGLLVPSTLLTPRTKQLLRTLTLA